MYGGHRWYSPFFQYWRIIDCTNVEEVIPPFNAAIPSHFCIEECASACLASRKDPLIPALSPKPGRTI